jgi:hypothetical protein
MEGIWKGEGRERNDEERGEARTILVRSSPKGGTASGDGEIGDVGSDGECVTGEERNICV